MTEDEMVGWHHQLKGHEFEQAPGDGEGQGSLVCCTPWSRKVRHDCDRSTATYNEKIAIIKTESLKFLT